MNKRIKLIVPLAIVSLGCAVAATACGGTTYEYPPYSYQNPNLTPEDLVPDSEITLDGKSEESFWQSAEWLEIRKDTDKNINLRATSYIGEKGLYMLFDVDDPFVYSNDERDTAFNSGIEIYLSADRATGIHGYEIDLNCDGNSLVKKYNTSGNFMVWNDRVALGVQPKGGAVNTTECNGYVIEAFFPNRLFNNKSHDCYYADIAVVSTNDMTSYDRDWYPFGMYQFGAGWMTPSTWFRFGENGFMDGSKVSLTGEHATLATSPMCVNGFDYSAEIVAEEGFAITGISLNSKDVTSEATETECGFIYKVKNAKEDLVFGVTTEAVTEGNKTLTGSVYLHADKQLTAADSATVTLVNAEKQETPITLTGGQFTVSDLAQGLYTLRAEKEGHETLSQIFNLNRDRNIRFVLEADSIFEENEKWDVSERNDGIVATTGGSQLTMKGAQDKFVFGFIVKPDERALNLAASYNQDLRYEVNAWFDSEETALKGKYVAYDLLCEFQGGSPKWRVQIPQHGANLLPGADEWVTAYTLTAAQVNTLMKEGLPMQLVRNGATFFLYVNGIKVDTRTVESAADAKMKPGLMYYGVELKTQFEYTFTTDYSLTDLDGVSITVDEGIEHGTVSTDKDAYVVSDSVVITAIPDEGYILVDILVNGYSYADEITDDNTLTVNFDAKNLHIVPEFVQATGTVDKKIVNISNADGLTVRLKNTAGVVSGSEKTVANGKVEFHDVAVGRYQLEYKVLGFWVTADKLLTVNGRGSEATIVIENVSVLTGGSWTTQRLPYNNQEAAVGGLTLGDGWFVTKISDLTTSDGEIRFGFRVDYADATGYDYTLLKDSDSNAWKFQVLNSWKGCGLGGTIAAYIESGTPFYFAVQREKASGTLNLFMGTGTENLKKVGTVQGEGEGKDIVKFGIIKYNGDYDLTFSKLAVGDTAQSAFGVTLSSDPITVTGADNVQNGTVGVAAEKGGKVELTFTPDERCVLVELKVNGVDLFAEYDAATKKVLVSDCYLSDTLAVSVRFERVAPVTPTVTFGSETNGLQLKLAKGGEAVADSMVTVAAGKAIFPELEIDAYEVWAYAFGVWGNTGATLSLVPDQTDYTVTIPNAAALAGGDWVKEAGTSGEVALSGLTLGDGWFATKISGLTTCNGEIRFGFRVDYADATGYDYTLLKDSGSNVWKFQVLNSWKSCDLGGTIATWIESETPFYFAVQREKASGTLNLFMGTGTENLKKVGTVQGEGEGKDIVKFGIIKYNGDYDLTFSQTCYGKTVEEAFGYEANAEINVVNNAQSEKLSENHGAITVTGSKVGEAVTLAISLDTSDKTKHYVCTSVKVNGKERLSDFISGSLALSQMYLSDTLTIEATFAEAEKYSYSATVVELLKAGQNLANGNTLVFTDQSGVATEAEILDGKISVELYQGTYTVTIKGNSDYVFEYATVSVSEDVSDGSLKAAYMFFENAADYASALSQNTAVSKTVNGQTVTLYGETVANGQNIPASQMTMRGTLPTDFAAGLYFALPQSGDYTVTGETRPIGIQIAFADNSIFLPYLVKEGNSEAYRGWKVQFPGDNRNYDSGKYTLEITDWRSYAFTDEQLTALQSTGVYMQVVKQDNILYVLLNGTIMCSYKTEKEVASVSFIRTDGDKMDGFTFAYNFADTVDLSSGALYKNVSVKAGSVAANEEFEASFLMQVPPMGRGNFRSGFSLRFAEKTWSFDITNDSWWSAKFQLTDGTSVWDQIGNTYGNDSSEYGAMKNDGVMFKMKRVNDGENMKLEFYFDNTLIYTLSTGNNSHNIDISAAFKVEISINNVHETEAYAPNEGNEGKVILCRDYSFRKLEENQG